METSKNDVCIYFKVFGMAEDEKGKPSWAGMKLSIGHASKDVPYSDIQKRVLSVPDWKKEILCLTHLETIGIKPENIELITPEEYERDYGDDDEETP